MRTAAVRQLAGHFSRAEKRSHDNGEGRKIRFGSCSIRGKFQSVSEANGVLFRGGGWLQGRGGCRLGEGGNVINTELGWHQRTEGLMVLSGDVVVLVIMAPQIGRL